MKIKTIIFDLGNVLVRWNPANLYRKIFANEQEVHHFLSTVCTMAWHTLQDAGRSPREGTEALQKQFPHLAVPIGAYYSRWKEMFDGPIDGSVQILKEVKERGYRVYALTNWNRELYDQTAHEFPFLAWFDGLVISGEEGMKKPDETIYRLLLHRYGINPAEALFIDDNPDNVATARRLGLHGIQFTGAGALRTDLHALQIL